MKSQTVKRKQGDRKTSKASKAFKSVNKWRHALKIKWAFTKDGPNSCFYTVLLNVLLNSLFTV